MKCQKVTKSSKYTQASPGDVTLDYQTAAGQTIIPLSPQDTSGIVVEPDKVTYAESVFYNVNQSLELLLKNAPVPANPHHHRPPKQPSLEVETLCYCVQKDPTAMCRQKNNRFAPPPAELSRSYSSLPRMRAPPADPNMLNRKASCKQHAAASSPRHTYICEQNQRILREIKTASLRNKAAHAQQQHAAPPPPPEIINIHRGPGSVFYDECGTEHFVLRPCELQQQCEEYPPGRGEQMLGTSRRSPCHVSTKRRQDGDGMDSTVDDSGLEMPDLHRTGNCACEHVVYSPTAYNCLQDERMFAPAPDVTRRMGSTTTLTKPEPPGSPPYYRSTSASSSNSGSSRGGLDLTSKHWWIIATVLLFAAAVGVGVPIALKVSSGASFEERLEFASRLLQETPLIDGHNDLPWNIRKFMHNKLKNFKFDSDLREVAPWSNSAWSHTDLGRLEQGHVSAQFWAAYVPCDSQHKDAVQLTLEQIDVIRRITDWYHPRLVLCTSAEDIRKTHKQNRMCSLIGVEGGHSLAGSLAVLRTLYYVGVRYLTLTSTCNTPWADCSHVDMPGKKPEHGGLTNFGKAVIKEMNRLGMIVDLSHVSIDTMRDALDVSKAPVIFSHSSAHALCNSTRNVPDDTLRKLAANGGVVMVNFYSLFLTCKETATVFDTVAHINHIREVAGVDNVGLGAGYDGINYVPQGLEDVSSYPTLFAELIGTGKWSVDELKKLAGLNFLRVMENVERVRDEFKKANVPPYEDVMPRAKGTGNCTSPANY